MSVVLGETQYFYNTRGFLTEKRYPDGNGTQYAYDADGRVTQRIWDIIPIKLNKDRKKMKRRSPLCLVLLFIALIPFVVHDKSIGI